MPAVPEIDHAAPVLDTLAAVLGEDAIFVLAGTPRDLRESLEGLLLRRGPAYAALAQGQPLARMTGNFDAWVIEMVRAMAPVAPPGWVPMMEVVREKVTLEIGARGLRSLFSTKPSDKDVARVKRYGTLAVRVLRAVYAADGPLDAEERTTAAAVVAALGLPEAEAHALHGEGAVRADSLEVGGEVEPAVARAIVRGAWLAAASDAIDPREEGAIVAVSRKIGVSEEESEAARRDALERVDARRETGLAAVEGVRYILSDRCPGVGVQIAALTANLLLPRRWRDEALAGVGQGAPVTLAGRHAGLGAAERSAVLGIAWAASAVDAPTLGRRALLRARYERLSQDLGEDDPAPREWVERWLWDALAGVARTIR